jgi:hypothetical protein
MIRFNKKNKGNDYISAQDAEVKILFSSENPSLLGKTIQTTAIEMSPKGLRLEVAHAIEIDSVLDIMVKFKSSDRKYYLTGNVRWRVPSVTGEYHIGLILRERTDVASDFKAWKRNFEHHTEMAQAV